MKKLAYIAAAVLAVSACTTTARSPDTPASASRSPAPSPVQSTHASRPVWRLKWSTDFADPAPLGSFSGCNNFDRTPAAFCSGLPADVRSQWWAYPQGWPDSAMQVHRRIGGYYDPAGTVWISGHQMHIRMFRATGPIHSAAVVPKAAIGMLYGKYVERFEVDPEGSPGYRSSHLLWPTNPPIDYEVDFPEGEWAGKFCVHVHYARTVATRDRCLPGVQWTQWHTTEIAWRPGSVTFYLDGREIFRVTGQFVPDEPMSWIIQNESALNGDLAPANSSAQINISSVAVYSYVGGKS